jgi:hypothetical protein
MDPNRITQKEDCARIHVQKGASGEEREHREQLREGVRGWATTIA